MHRYGLVHMWHLEHQQKKNRECTKEKRDDELFHARGNLWNIERPQPPVSDRPTGAKSDGSRDSIRSNPDVDFLDACEVVKAKKERAAAHRRLEKAEVDLEDSERRIRQLSAQLANLAGADLRLQQECELDLEVEMRTVRNMRQEVQNAKKEVQDKEESFNSLTKRKSSI